MIYIKNKKIRLNNKRFKKEKMIFKKKLIKKLLSKDQINIKILMIMKVKFLMNQI